MEKEKIELAVIYKQDGFLGIDLPNEKDVLSFELYGFLKLYLRNIEKMLQESIR